MLRNVEGWGESNLVEYPAVEDGLKQVVCKHHIPGIKEIIIMITMIINAITMTNIMIMDKTGLITHFRLNGSLFFINRGPMYLNSFIYGTAGLVTFLIKV